MSKIEMLNLLKTIRRRKQRSLIVPINRRNLSESVENARKLFSDLERLMRIQKLEMSVKKMNIKRSLL